MEQLFCCDWQIGGDLSAVVKADVQICHTCRRIKNYYSHFTNLCVYFPVNMIPFSLVISTTFIYTMSKVWNNLHDLMFLRSPKMHLFD